MKLKNDLTPAERKAIELSPYAHKVGDCKNDYVEFKNNCTALAALKVKSGVDYQKAQSKVIRSAMLLYVRSVDAPKYCNHLCEALLKENPGSYSAIPRALARKHWTTSDKEASRRGSVIRKMLALNIHPSLNGAKKKIRLEITEAKGLTNFDHKYRHLISKRGIYKTEFEAPHGTILRFKKGQVGAWAEAVRDGKALHVVIKGSSKGVGHVASIKVKPVTRKAG